MIFDKLVALKISLDFYKSRRNILKKVLHYFLLKSIMDKIKVIKKSVLSFEVLSEFQEFVKIVDPNEKSNIISNEYTYSDKYAQEIIIKQTGIGNIIILLRHKDNSIEIEFPLSPRMRANRIYKHTIEDMRDGIPDKNTITINNSIRNYIYDFIISYMKGEFDDAVN